MKEFNKTYHIYNSEILALIDNWKKAPKKKKCAIQGEIISKMKYMVNNRIFRYKNTGIYQDLFQEGCLGIITAMEKFDPNRCVNFFHYSTWHIQNKIRVFLHKHNKFKCEIPLEHLPEYMEEDSTSLAIRNNDDRNAIFFALKKLPEIDQQVIILRFGLDCQGGKTYHQIGDIFSLSKQRIEQITSRAIVRLRDDKSLEELFF